MRSLFDMFLSGMTLREITDYLKAEGIKTKSGKDTWSIASVQNILKSDCAIIALNYHFAVAYTFIYLHNHVPKLLGNGGHDDSNIRQILCTLV